MKLNIMAILKSKKLETGVAGVVLVTLLVTNSSELLKVIGILI